MSIHYTKFIIFCKKKILVLGYWYSHKHMTKREDELLEEIATLKEKLTHAQSWMKRQVDESMPEDSGFFS